MKKIRLLLAMILVAALLASLAAMTTAEVQVEDGWQADIRTLMDDSLVPKTTTIQFDHKLSEDVQIETHRYDIEKINNDGMTMRINFSMLTTADFSEDDWAEIDAWLNATASSAIQGIALDTESLANAVANAIADARKNNRPDVEADAPAWTDDRLLLSSIAVTIPYYPELSNGVNGSATQKLQETLIRLGYLDDRADGYFGAKTQAAVEQLEKYIRELEQDVIDALPTVEPTATPIPTATPEPTMAVPEDQPLDAEPTASPEPTEAPLPTPATPVDGIADSLLMAYLYSDDFVVAREELSNGSQGDAVQRLQRRLVNLGYMVGSADGIYGGGTARAVRIFQYYNNLPQTGTADLETQKLLFSENAKAPDNGMLSSGSSGDAVKKLQLRLRILGFMNGSVDGDYGNATVAGVKNLQQYMRDLEEMTLRSDAEVMASLNGSGEDISSLLTVEVNGVADPILLDDFYANTFPALPDAMENGSSGIDVVRLQRRLNCLEYYYGSLDGSYGSGTESAVRAFQKRNGLTQSGVAGTDTLALLFSEDALKALKPYVLKISTADQRVYAYGLDNNNEYTVLVRTMKCSTGKDSTPTPKGTFQNSTGPGARWHYFTKYKCWAQYAYYIQGDIMFHSVLYNEKDGPVTQSSVNNLGRKASHGCVRLSVEDAKWIYTNCPVNTKIIVY